MKRTPQSGSRRHAAHPKRAISTVFVLIRDLLAERRNELAERSPPPAVGRAALFEDIAIEHRGRLLELVELANRISVLGFEHFGQRLDLLSVVQPAVPLALRRKGAP